MTLLENHIFIFCRNTLQFFCTSHAYQHQFWESHHDINIMVDWVLKINYLFIYLSDSRFLQTNSPVLVVPLWMLRYFTKHFYVDLWARTGKQVQTQYDKHLQLRLHFSSTFMKTRNTSNLVISVDLPWVLVLNLIKSCTVNSPVSHYIQYLRRFESDVIVFPSTAWWYVSNQELKHQPS